MLESAAENLSIFLNASFTVKSAERRLQRSISERLYCLPDATVVYPGHGPATTIIREKEENPHVRSAAHMA